MPGLIRRLWRFGAGLVAVVLILLAILVGLIRLALVQVPEYRDQVEALASETLGWPVTIRTMDARWGMRGPEIRFVEARVLTRDRSATLVAAARGSMRLDLLALLRGRLQPGEVGLSGVVLRIERTVEGRWRLLGEKGPALADPAAPDEDGAGQLPLLSELPTGTLWLQDVQVEYEDLSRKLGPWLFALDELLLELAGAQLSLSLAGSLPADLGGEVELSLAVQAQDERGRPRDWHAGLSATTLDLGGIGRAIGRPEFLPAAGHLSGDLSTAVRGGELQRLAGVLRARDLQSVPAALLDEPFVQLESRFDWHRTATGWRAQLDELAVRRAAREWRNPAATLVYEQTPGARRLEARVGHVVLEDLQPLAHWLPDAARTRVAALAPAGVVRDLELHIDLPAEAGHPPDAHLSAQFEELSVGVLDPWPGLSGLSGSIDGDLYRGTARLDCRDASFSMPRMFRVPIELDSAVLTLGWTRDAQGLRFQAPEFALVNPDAAVSGEALLEVPADRAASPQLEITATARDVRATAAPAYLPVSIMPEAVVDWLDRAIVAGHSDEARFTLRGPTRQFPFREGEGTFKVEFDLHDAELDFDPGWPNATGLEAQLRFENEGLWAQVDRGGLLQIDGGPLEVAIPDLRRGELSIRGAATGRLAALRELALDADFLEDLLGAGLEPAEVTAGSASVHVDLELPLLALAETRARVRLDIREGEFGYGFLGAPLTDVEGRIEIDNARVTAERITGRLAGWPVVARIEVLEDDAVQVAMGGQQDARGLGEVLQLPIELWASGEGEWTGHMHFPPAGTEAPLSMEFSSRLAGFAIDLPEPFAKPAAEPRSLRVAVRLPDARLAEGELEWDEALRVAFRLDRSGPALELLPVPGAVEGDPSGLVVSGAVPRVDLAGWLGLEIPRELERLDLAQSLAGGRLLVGELTAPALHLTDLLLDVARGSGRWQLSLAGEGVEGTLELPFAPHGDEPVRVRLQRLWLEDPRPEPGTQPEPARRTDAPAWSMHPASIPALDLEIEELRFGTLRFGSISARILHDADGIELIGLEGMGDGYIFQAEGRSRLSETIDTSRLGLSLHSDNVGATLEYMGFRRSMSAREGRFSAELSWRGGLRSDWLRVMEGEASIQIRNGTLLGVEPGAGRVFGLLSLQALPRRLALDFKDVFGEGTAFDRISGDFQFSGGHAITENLVMRGPTANIAVVGRTGLVERDYDQTAVIAADLGRTLPVAGAVVAGPAVGAALFVLSEVLRRPFQTQIAYRLTGTWEHPVIERVAAGTTPPAAPSADNQPQKRPRED